MPVYEYEHEKKAACPLGTIFEVTQPMADAADNPETHWQFENRDWEVLREYDKSLTLVEHLIRRTNTPLAPGPPRNLCGEMNTASIEASPSYLPAGGFMSIST